ncbi:hypothetical protein BDQ17DRAFT_1439920 [Cyathus striatus]|nr:hypothetical protein BDQ17DRAFT_1439920 [Cyathus striatus]
MPGPYKSQKIFLARAREAKARKKLGLNKDTGTSVPTVGLSDHGSASDNESESDGTHWQGTIYYVPSNSEDSGGEWEEHDDSDEDNDADSDLEELEGANLLRD